MPVLRYWNAYGMLENQQANEGFISYLSRVTEEGYMNKAVEQLGQEGYPIDDEDLKHIRV